MHIVELYEHVYFIVYNKSIWVLYERPFQCLKNNPKKNIGYPSTVYTYKKINISTTSKWLY